MTTYLMILLLQRWIHLLRLVSKFLNMRRVAHPSPINALLGLVRTDGLEANPIDDLSWSLKIYTLEYLE